MTLKLFVQQPNLSSDAGVTECVACIDLYRFIGGLYGRAVGHMFVYAHGGIPVTEYWLWIDPGAFALMGAASFFSGVTRLTFSLAIIIVRTSIIRLSY